MNHKSSVRERVFAELRKVALPDSRFHYDFGEFIADFAGSDQAVDALMAHRFYRDANMLFITPDNCLEQLRYRTLLDGKRILIIPRHADSGVVHREGPVRVRCAAAVRPLIFPLCTDH